MSELELIYQWLGQYEDNGAIFKSAGQWVAQTLSERSEPNEAEGLTIADAIRNHQDKYEKKAGKQ